MTTFRTTGVVNIGQVGLGMWGAYVADQLHTDGTLVLPWVVIPSKTSLGGGWPVWPAALVGVLSSAVVGVAIYLLVFRPLRRSPQLAKIVATVGLLLTLQALIVQQFTNSTRSPASLLPSGMWDVAPGIPVDRFILAGIALVVAVGVAAFQRFSLIGTALRAGAEDETSVALSGWSSTALGALGWGGGAAISGLLIILAAPDLSLSPTTFPELLVPGLAVALVGRLSSVTVAAVAGLVLGALQSDVVLLTSKSWWPTWAHSGLGDAVPFVMVVVVLMVMGRRLPDRGEAVTDRLPPAPRGRLRWSVVAVTAVGGVALVSGTSGTYRFGVITSLVFVLFMLSMVVVTGLVGQVSLAQAAVAGVAAFVLVRLTPGVVFPLNIVLAALAAGAAGLIVGIPALRIRGGQLAVVTLAGAVAIGNFWFGNVVSTPTLPSPHLFGANLAVHEGTNIARLPFGLFVLIVVIMAGVVVARLTRGRWGRRFLAVRDDERAAAAAGVAVARTKLMAFGVSAVLAGFGGALLAYSQGQASAPAFAVLVGVSFVIYAYLGGITSVSGALVGALVAPAGLFYVWLDGLVDLGNWYGLISGVGLLLAIVQNPRGAVGAAAQVRDHVLARWRRAHPRPIPAVRLEPVLQAVDRRRIDGEVVLEVADLSVRYGGVTAVDHVSFHVSAGEIVGLIGANGAGKTSLIDALTGFAAATGSVVLAGRSLSRCAPTARYRAGLARTWQSPSLFLDLTVKDNVAVASGRSRLGDTLRDVFGVAEPFDAVDAALVRAGAWHLADRLPDELSTGQQRTAALARALAADPAVLLADEPAAGLNTTERPELIRRLRDIAGVGTGVLLVEHDLELVLGICDRIVVMDLGRVIATGTPTEVRSDPAVIAAYIGAAVEDGVEEPSEVIVK